MHAAFRISEVIRVSLLRGDDMVAALENNWQYELNKDYSSLQDVFLTCLGRTLEKHQEHTM